MITFRHKDYVAMKDAASVLRRSASAVLRSIALDLLNSPFGFRQQQLRPLHAVKNGNETYLNSLDAASFGR